MNVYSNVTFCNDEIRCLTEVGIFTDEPKECIHKHFGNPVGIEC